MMLEEKFNDRYIPVPEAGCWLWTASVGSHGYGDLRHNKTYYLAHRLAYQLYVSPIPDGKYVLHRCDNRLCVNPVHLFIGNHNDNMSDMNNKGRQVGGGRGTGRPVLNITVAQNIRAIVKSGVKQKDVAKAYGLHPDHIRKIVNRKVWR